MAWAYRPMFRALRPEVLADTLRPLLKHRLIMGVTLIAALIGALWVDQWLQDKPTPEWLIWLLTSKMPPGMAMLLIGLVVVPMGAREMGRMFRANGVMASRRWMAIAGTTGLVVTAVVPSLSVSPASVELK